MAAQTNDKLRLKSVKLSGFKSFVDPTEVPLPSALVGVVGPNGCGKSNIIDATRWVMGESSAKLLRGESMADVIFNGSGGRKPLGQASVELVFDNPHGALGGEYAQYAEIAIRRQVTRDGQSTYFLNNTRCRRKDITNIFLGTGLGPRSYAIIGQGTISRLIEAKPEELRVFMEEAAGISKYKERRRETENRIRHTRENLDRLEDLREELDKQLKHLQRQANAAERFKEFKQEERTLRAQLLGLRWQSIDKQLSGYDDVVNEQQIQLEASIAKQREADNNIEKVREQHTEFNDEFNAIQDGYYDAGAVVARIEQSLQHQRERQQQLREDLARAEQALADAKQHVSSDEQHIAELQQQQERITPEFEISKEKTDSARDALHQAEQQMQDWQHQWDDFNAQSAKASEQAQVQQTRIQHLEQTMLNSKQRIERLQEEHAKLDSTELNELIAELQAQLEEIQQQQESLKAELQTLKDERHNQQQANQATIQELDKQRSQLQRMRGRHASLDALQQAALGKQNNLVKEWLTQHQLVEQARLAEGMEVASGWERAVETVLGQHLQAICVDNIDPIVAVLDSLQEGKLDFVETSTTVTNNNSHTSAELLNQKVTAQGKLASYLSGIYIAEDLTAAMAMRSQLQANESVITKDGIWIGPNWLRVNRSEDAEAGVIQRKRDLAELDTGIAAAVRDIAELEQQLNLGREQLQFIEQQCDAKQTDISGMERKLADTSAQLRIKENRRDQVIQRIEQMQKESAELTQQVEKQEAELNESRSIWQTAMSSMETHAEQREVLEEQRGQLRESLQVTKQQAREYQDQTHQLSLQHQRIETELNAKSHALERTQQQLVTLVERQEQLSQSLANSDDPIIALQTELDEALELRVNAEEELTQARQKIQAYEAELRDLEKVRHEAEQQAEKIRNKLADDKLQWQALTVRAKTIIEQLEEAEQDLQTVLNEMPEEANEAEWDSQLERIGQRIQRLGPINLAAIDEYNTQSERKTYLDSQNEDLIEALTTLENAIRKIDKETRQRFKETYEIVNNGFKTLFPKIFGGGSAYLDLTGDDLLEAGVSVMARPPGKKNSTIHLLSGGEKALTAIALVFAIFKLNPAPFCMLDEVDAPLDDANVVRFCNLVKEMSKEVQFVFISHNKVAIEMAEYLAGVTMKEPGVSRMVSVDIDEAMAMADVE